MTVTAIDTATRVRPPHNPGISKTLCPCTRCHQLRNTRRRAWRKLTDQGRRPLRVPVQEAVDLVNYWRGHGYTCAVIASAVGLTPEWVRKLGECNLIDRRTIDDLARLTHSRLISAARDDELVPVIGVVRRMQALAWRGWSARAMGLPNPRAIEQIVLGYSSSTSARLHRQVQQAFLEHEMIEAPGGRAQGIRERARAKGWVSPLAWDPESIDDPEAQPWRESPAAAEAARAAFIEDVDYLITACVSVEEICDRLGVRMDTAEQRLRRAGKRGDARARDLARRFNAELQRTRRKPDDDTADDVAS